jgi:galactokinase
MKCFTKRTTAKQDKLIKRECRKEFYKLLDLYNREAAVQVLHILHFDFGFGEKRLQRFADKLNEMQRKQKEQYELDFSDTAWLCEKQLADEGFNIDKFIENRGDT